MNNNDSQSKKDAEKELTAKEERFTYEKEEQDRLSEQDAAIEEELLKESQEDLPESRNDEISAAAASATESQQQSPKGGSGKVWMAIAAVLAILLVVVLIKPPFGAGSNDAVATVNGANISKDKLYDALVTAGGPSTLENLITQELIMQEAKAASITVTDADIDAELAIFRERFGTEEAFNDALAQSNYTIERLRDEVRVDLTVRKILEPQTDVTDEEIQQYYDANKETLGTPEEVQASHILVATKEEADAILAELNQGGDFAAIAKEKSTDPGSKDNGGDLGFFGRGVMDPAFEEAAFALDVNEISDVVQSQHGFHIIKKTAEKAAVVPTFEEKKDEIRSQLVAAEAGELSGAWLTKIREKAKITNTLAPAEEPAAAAPAGETSGNTPAE
ncbi:foldase protein PrsA [Paenibacillus sp. sgz302251]|uniref:foldase protein PrsA n=1 Tax=Paenibacillus sp. sgz302251 TaxID=3414493 RepID=UPI003C7E85C1